MRSVEVTASRDHREQRERTHHDERPAADLPGHVTEVEIEFQHHVRPGNAAPRSRMRTVQHPAWPLPQGLAAQIAQSAHEQGDQQ
jgi:hypothetical protein